MPTSQSEGAIRTIGADSYVDAMFSADGTRLYAVAGPFSNEVSVLDVATGGLLLSYTVGSALKAIDLSPDERYLAVVERYTGIIHRIDLTTATTTSYSTLMAPNGFHDVVFLSDGTVLLSQNAGNLLSLDFASSNFRVAAEGDFRAATLIESADNSRVLVQPTGYDWPTYVYEVGEGITASAIAHPEPHDPTSIQYEPSRTWAQGFGVGAISPAGNLIVEGMSLNVYDTHLNLLVSLSERFPYLGYAQAVGGNTSPVGMDFSPDASRLYLAPDENELIVIDTATWDVIGSYQLGAYPLFPRERSIRDQNGPPVGYGDIVQVSPDGRYVAVIGEHGVMLVDTNTAILGAGPTADVIADSSNRLYGFGGNDTLAGTSFMFGGERDDSYYLQPDRYNGSPSGTVWEFADQGTDTVFAFASYNLSPNIENLTFTGSNAADGIGNASDNVLTGNSAANRLNGEAGNDTLAGAAGIDTLTGGAGSDTFRDTAAGLNRDVITDLTIEDRIVITDADPNSFSFSMYGEVLTFTGASLTLSNVQAGGSIVATAASEGGVQLNLVWDFGGRTGDFNGDGRDDIFWRERSGTVTDWLAQSNGTYAANGATFWSPVPTAWQVAGIGDFDGDNRDDVLWRNTDGTVTNWLGQANGAFSANAANVWAAVPNAWNVVSVGDFNGDGRDDILWRSADGLVTNWLGGANGSFSANGANVWSPVGPEWHVQGVGDFNGDGRDDILWRNADGLVTNWLGTANGNFLANAANVWALVGSEWHIQGVGDFNGDGRSDILWLNDESILTNWLGQANGGFAVNSSNFWTGVNSDWHIDSLGDFNGDGRDDILWRDGTGTTTNWLGQANGSANPHSAAWDSVPTTWQVQSHEFWL